LRNLTLGIIIALVTIGCGDTYINVPSPTAPTSPSEPVITSVKIEYRVTGNAASVKVRYSNEQDGLIQTVTTLPFFSTFSTNQSSAFVSLEVTPLTMYDYVQTPFISLQIFVNGNLFKEATANSFVQQTISVDGTWRR
jgi:hypothetical protein